MYSLLQSFRLSIVVLATKGFRWDVYYDASRILNLQDFDKPFKIGVAPVYFLRGVVLLVLSQVSVYLKYSMVTAKVIKIFGENRLLCTRYTYSLDHCGSWTFTLLYWLY